jgi:glycosyltransferase involved in cell wall biosynthesis
MRERLLEYGGPGRRVTLVPWALSEPAVPPPPRPEARRERFGDASLGLLYSGSFGRAHASEAILALARRLRGSGISFCFSVRGNRAEDLRRAVLPEDSNVRFVPFCEETELEAHLATADVHVASLRHEWSGVVVPSKFVGSLAAGRPVLFAGPRGSSIARWIGEHDVGWVLDGDGDNAGRVAEALQGLARDPVALAALQRRCHAVYQEQFSRERTLDRWDQELRSLLAP